MQGSEQTKAILRMVAPERVQQVLEPVVLGANLEGREAETAQVEGGARKIPVHAFW